MAKQREPGRSPRRAAADAAVPAARLPRLARAALLVVVTAAVYLPGIHGGFILDDNLLLTQNRLIYAPDGLYRIWLTREPIDYWPITNTTLWLEWRLWGMSPTGYHVTNVALHIATALLLWAVLRRLSIPGAFLAALLFAVHPVNVESVAWIAQRKNLLALLLSLVSVLWYLKAETSPERARRWYWPSLAAFAAAMLSKGSVAILPFLLLGALAWQRRLTRRDLARTAPFFLIAAVLVLVNVWFQSRFVSTDFPAASPVERLLGAGAVVWFYLYKALLPIDLSFVYPKWQIRAGELLWWLPLLAAGAATWALWHYRRRGSRPLLFAWGFFCVALAPVMGFTDVGFMEHSLVADHYQHVALIGVVTLVAAGWATWRRWASAGTAWLPDAAAAAVVAGLALLTWQQSGLYTDGAKLYRATLQTNPDSPFVHNNLGLELLALGRGPQAVGHFRQAVELRPQYAEAHYNLGRALGDAGQLDDAVGHYRQALELKPHYLAYHHALANALARAQRIPEAIEHFQTALRLDPDNAQAHNNLGTALLEAGRRQEAIGHYERALALEPDLPQAHANLARALLRAGQSQRAIDHFRQSMRLAPASPSDHNDLGVALANTGQLEPAIEQLEQALRLNPDLAAARSNLEEVRAMQQQAAGSSTEHSVRP